MFCQKCGAKLDDNARFCTTCGAKISAVNDKPVQPVQMSQVEGQIRQQMPYVSTGQVVQQPKKKKHMMPLLIGGIVLVLVVALLYTIIGGGSKIDYVRTVQEYTPFADSQGLPYTLREVMDEYFEDLVWEERTEDNVAEHCVEIHGTLKTVDESMRLLVGVEDDPDDPDICHFSFLSLKYEGGSSSNEDEIVNFLAALFYGYDEGYDVEELMDEMAAEEDTESDSLTMANPKSYADMIPIMQTQSFYDEGFGNLEVTLNEVGLVDSYINDWGIQNYADDGYVFLWISCTVNNIGTTSGMMPIGWNTLIYDGTYEYRDCESVGDILNIPPLSEPREGAFVYTLPVAVLESGKSFVFNINDASGEPFMSYTFNLDEESADMSESEMTQNITDPFLYTGKYEGYFGYEISFSAFTELVDDAVGIVDIYYNGELTAEQTVYECYDRGDWSDWDYDAFYVIHLGDQDAYLGFYERDGWKMLDYNGVTRNIDTLEMTEYYEAP